MSAFEQNMQILQKLPPPKPTYKNKLHVILGKDTNILNQSKESSNQPEATTRILSDAAVYAPDRCGVKIKYIFLALDHSNTSS